MIVVEISLVQVCIAQVYAFHFSFEEYISTMASQCQVTPDINLHKVHEMCVTNTHRTNTKYPVADSLLEMHSNCCLE